MQHIDSIDDPRVAAYRNLRDRTLRGESIFVTEGRVVTRRLLESRFAAESLFVAEPLADEFARLARHVPLYVGSDELLRAVVGFPFHLGVLGAGRRAAPLGLEHIPNLAEPAAACRLVICPEITKPENMGLVFRTAAAFGIDGVLLGERCCDPLSRRALRVSMGGTLHVPWVKSSDLSADLARLKDPGRLELWAAVVDPTAERLGDLAWPARVGLLLGNEFDGLHQRWLTPCERRLTIPMRPGVDSLNLGVAAGIFVYEMTHRDR